MKVQVDPARCQGHGRCYDLAPDFFDEDDEGYGSERNGGLVPPGRERDADIAARNCPERAIDVVDGPAGTDR